MAALLTDTADRRIRRVVVAATCTVTAASMVASYAGLTMLGRLSGMGVLSPLVPVMVDMLAIAAAAAILHGSLRGARTAYPWTLLVFAVATSTVGNLLASPVDTLVARLTHGLPAVTLALSIHLLMILVKGSVAATAAAEAEQRQQEQRRIAEEERRARAMEAAEVRGRERAAAMQALPESDRRAVEADSEVAAVRAVVATLSADAGTTDTLVAILRAIPGVRTSSIAQAEVLSVSNLYNAVSRARKRLAEQQQESTTEPDPDADAERERPALRAVAAV